MHADIPSRERGFTLIELLVALGVLSLTAGLLASSLNLAWFSSPARLKRGEDSVASGQRLLRARIEALAPLTRSDASRPIVDARGDMRLFSFAAKAADNEGAGPLRRYRLLVTPAGELMLYSASTLDDRIDLNDRSLVGWTPTKIISGVDEIGLSYFGPGRAGATASWQDYWIDRPQPPALVRVRLRFAASDTRRWPELVIAPKANANTECLIQPSTGRCEAP